MTNDIKPFLKWPGRKYSVLGIIKPHLLNIPKAHTLVEPFLGSAALFLNTEFKNYYLNDNNPDLVNIYLYLMNEGDQFIKYCAKYFKPENNDKERYLDLRAKFNATKSERLKAALFLYLNKHGFNGLCRYNSSGVYNVPFGSFKNILLPVKAMQNFHSKAQSVKIKIECMDFVQCLDNVNPGSVVYCDPPYVPISPSSSFTRYNKFDFTMEHQHKLVVKVKQLQKEGVHCLISNHDLTITRNLYHEAKIISYNIKRYISCKGSERHFVKELLAIYSSEKL